MVGVKEFYDSFACQQLKTGLNERTYHLYRTLRGCGLRSSSRILELGCGVGVLTRLLSRRLSSGYLEAVDISEQSVALAQQRIVSKNTRIAACDVVDYHPIGSQFDYILLFDVIEHIPLERHADLFANLARIASPHTRILINIPSPEMIDYLREHTPHLLQIIDQAIPLETLVANTERCGLRIYSCRKYSIWHEYDYMFFDIRPRSIYAYRPRSAQRNLWQRLIHKAKCLYIKML